MAEAKADKAKKPGWGTLARSLRNPKSGYMALFGFAAAAILGRRRFRLKRSA